MELKIKRLTTDENFKLPTYATDGSACMGVYALTAEVQGDGSILCRTGWAVAIPEGWAMLIYSRSGMGFNQNTRLSNCVGVIDSDYRDEVMVKLHCDIPGRLPQVKKGDRVAQFMLVPIEQVELDEVTTLPEATSTRSGGFGSTGQ